MGIIYERVARYRRLTTRTKVDMPAENNASGWSIEKAIDDQVQREDLIRDANTTVLPFQIVPELKIQPIKDKIAIYRFVLEILSL